MINQSILWRRIDEPGHEFSQLYFEDDIWRITGTSIFVFGRRPRRPVRLDYVVICDADWQTRSAIVTGWIGDETIRVDIAVDDSRRWRLNGIEVPEVEGCVDIDFNFSPSTNLLPIRRLRLDVGDEVAARAAWLRFPEFNLESLDQSYRRAAGAVYRYETRAGKFVADLSVNEAGFVTIYPDLWELEATA